MTFGRGSIHARRTLLSTLLFASIPVVAHSTNPLPFATRLVERGHRVFWYAGHAFHEAIAAAGAVPLPYVSAPDFSGQEIAEAFPEVAQLSGVAGIRRAFADIFVGHAPGRVADLQHILAAHRVDAVLADGLMYGVGLVHELGGPPWASFGDGPLPYEEWDTPPFGPALPYRRDAFGALRNGVVRPASRLAIFGPAERRYRQIRRSLGLPRATGPVISQTTSPYLHLQGCTPGFEYPRQHRPAHLHWGGGAASGPAPGVDPTAVVARGDGQPPAGGAGQPGQPAAGSNRTPGAGGHRPGRAGRAGRGHHRGIVGEPTRAGDGRDAAGKRPGGPIRALRRRPTVRGGLRHQRRLHRG